MAEKRSFTSRLMTWVIVFLVGGAAGWYVRDQQYENIQQELSQVRQELKSTREELRERTRRAGQELRGGAEAAADSAEGAVREMVGDTSN